MDAGMDASIAEFGRRLSEGKAPEALSALRRLALEPLKVLDYQKIERIIEENGRLCRESAEEGPLRVAVLGGYTTQPVRLALRTLLVADGYYPEFYESEYNTFKMEVLDPKSGLYAFKPDVVLFATGSLNLQALPAPGDGPERAEELLKAALEEYEGLWKRVAEKTGAMVFQNNFDPREESPLGRLDGKHPAGLAAFIRRVNEGFWRRDGASVRIVDVEGLAVRVGLRHWHDPRWYFHSKHGFNPSLACEYGWLFMGTFRAARGKARKCLVTDLDNTLWGGTVGDDGLAGIQLGSVSPEGEAHAVFCRYLKALKDRGVLLAVNSKNDPAAAREVFEKHPEMPLRLDDFSAFYCNWNSKSSNLLAIARDLNIGLDAMVYIDDNPVECAEAATTGVTALEMGGDPAYFIRRLERPRFFDPAEVTEEDLGRTAAFRVGREVKRVEGSPPDLNRFLEGLGMKGSVAPAAPQDAGRVDQLFSKTNQFNMTSRRHGPAEAGRGFCFVCRLKDDFMNYGIVSSLIGHVEGREFHIDNWVMSCRVFSRTFEHFIMERIKEAAAAKGCGAVSAEFVPTPRNGYVRGLYETLGFAPVPSREGGGLRLELQSARTLDTFVKPEEGNP